MQIKKGLTILILGLCWSALSGCSPAVPFTRTTPPVQTPASDTLADKMLVFQRASGGWPKAINDKAIDYKKPLTEAERLQIQKDSLTNDATIDNQATTRELTHLIKAYQATQNPRYLQAVEKGIAYLLNGQYENGGWPQFFPNPKGYQNHITFNDGAMVRTLNILKQVAEGKQGFERVDKKWAPLAQKAVAKGVDCILKTQILRNGQRTGWCQQYDRVTLQPAKARTYELPSNSGQETVGVSLFLMSLDQPSAEVKEAVAAAVKWLEEVKISGWAYQRIDDPSQPTKKDAVLVADSASTVWARYYDLDTNRPFFCGRDGIKKNTLAEIENERRVGYAWYGPWAEKLLAKDFPKWAAKWKP